MILHIFHFPWGNGIHSERDFRSVRAIYRRLAIWEVHSQYWGIAYAEAGATQVDETYWEVLCYFQICTQVTEWRSRGVKQMSWANYLFGGLEEKSSLVSRLTASTDAEIAERNSESMTLHVTESNEDTYKSDTIFDSFH